MGFVVGHDPGGGSYLLGLASQAGYGDSIERTARLGFQQQQLDLSRNRYDLEAQLAEDRRLQAERAYELQQAMAVEKVRQDRAKFAYQKEKDIFGQGIELLKLDMTDRQRRDLNKYREQTLGQRDRSLDLTEQNQNLIDERYQHQQDMDYERMWERDRNRNALIEQANSYPEGSRERATLLAQANGGNMASSAFAPRDKTDPSLTMLQKLNNEIAQATAFYEAELAAAEQQLDRLNRDPFASIRTQGKVAISSLESKIAVLRSQKAAAESEVRQRYGAPRNQPVDVRTGEPAGGQQGMSPHEGARKYTRDDRTGEVGWMVVRNGRWVRE